MKLSAIHAASTGQIRTTTFENREHLVVPVVALVEGVIRASNAPTSELVLIAELEKTLAGWNGEPVMLNHPEDTDGKISANYPRTLEQTQIGRVFNARLKDKQLEMEAWIDVAKCDRVAGGAEMVERLRNAEAVEVSVGAFVQTEARKGTHKGQKYEAVWKTITPDHLALLPKGMQGACSWEAGCGVRAACRAAAFNNRQPRARDGKWVDGPTEVINKSLDQVFASPSWQLTDVEKGALKDFFDSGKTDFAVLPNVKTQTIANHINRRVVQRFKGVEMKTRGERIASLLAREDVERGDGVVTKLLALSDDEFEQFEEEVLQSQPSLMDRILGKKKIKKVPASYSDMDLRRDLELSLREEPGFIGLDSVFPDDSELIYMVMAGDKIQTFRRPYKEKGDDYEFGDPEEVHAVTRYEPVAAAEVRTACGCQVTPKGAPVLRFREAKFQSNQPRDKDGKWTDGGGTTVGGPGSGGLITKKPASGPTPIVVGKPRQMFPAGFQQKLRNKLGKSSSAEEELRKKLNPKPKSLFPAGFRQKLRRKLG